MLKRIANDSDWLERLDNVGNNRFQGRKYSELILIPGGTSNYPTFLIVGKIGEYAEKLGDAADIFQFLQDPNQRIRFFIQAISIQGRNHMLLKCDNGVFEVTRPGTWDRMKVRICHPHDDLVATLPPEVTGQPVEDSAEGIAYTEAT